MTKSNAVGQGSLGARRGGKIGEKGSYQDLYVKGGKKHAHVGGYKINTLTGQRGSREESKANNEMQRWGK